MKLWLIVVAMMLAAGTASAQKQRYSQSSQRAVELDYPVMVHVAHARLTGAIGGGTGTLHLDTVIDGKTVELEAGAGALLHTGDYRARVVSDEEKKSGWFSKTYELIFSDGTKVVFTEVAESE
jgi:hypothetical protein